MNSKYDWNMNSFLSSILIGVILFWIFGKDWLDLRSIPILLAGLIGVVVAVLAFGAWNIFTNSHHKEN